MELEAGTNPLVDDFMVTVFFNGMTITDDGDWEPGDHNGDFAFDFGVRLPGGGEAGLGTFKSVVHDTVLLTDPFSYDLALTDQQVEPYLPNIDATKGQGSLTNNQGSRGIAFDGDGPEGQTTLTLARYLSASKRSFNIGMTPDQSFSVEGIVAELDNKYNDKLHDNSANPDDYNVHWVYLGGVDGLQATKADGDGKSKVRAVFRGKDLENQTSSSFVDYRIYFETTDNLDPESDKFAGYLSFTIFVG